MLSLVLPAYRATRTLPAALDALVRSARVPDEIVVVDDGCPDGSGDVAERWQGTLPLRVLHHMENRGTSAARNTGWRAARGDLVAFVDVDVGVLPDALGRLEDALDDEALLGANGTLAPSQDMDVVSAFVNTSLRYQLRAHGPRVASAFTSLCVLRRDTLEKMGGWDERRASRYGDDVATRWVLPPESLAQVPEAQGTHHKQVPLGGMLRHRANVGAHFVASLRENRQAVTTRPKVALLDARYPLNTMLAAASLPALAGAALGVPGARLTCAGLGVAFLGVNARFLAFVAEEDGPGRAALAVPLTFLEGHAYLAGMMVGVRSLFTAQESHAAP